MSGWIAQTVGRSKDGSTLGPGKSAHVRAPTKEAAIKTAAVLLNTSEHKIIVTPYNPDGWGEVFKQSE